MDDYISRQAFRESLINTPFYPRCKTTPDLLTSVQDRLNDTIELLDNFPPAAVRLMVRGRWGKGNKSKIYPMWDNYTCSICGDIALCGYMKHPVKTNYCPNCGADMRGDDAL